ncbi:unnamed protein product [Caenorhabditis sp. 36 PRJEB53466]|nr:unnamed protein product [Caenorhabditis sp. 36 PRJEB53466]
MSSSCQDVMPAVEELKIGKICENIHTTSVTEAISRLEEEHFSQLFVNGGPATGKTRFLTQCALKWVTMGKTVVCTTPCAEAYEVFLREFEKRKTEAEWPEALNTDGAVLNLEELEIKLMGTRNKKKSAEKKKKIFEGCKIVIGHIEHKSFLKIIRTDYWKYDGILIDDSSYLNFPHYRYIFSPKKRKDAAFVISLDIRQGKINRETSLADDIMDQLRHNKCREEHCTKANWTTFLQITAISKSYYKWINHGVYGGRLKVCNNQNPGVIDFVSSTTLYKNTHQKAGQDGLNPDEAKIVVEKAEELIRAGRSPQDICILAEFVTQIDEISRLLDLSKFSKEVRVGLPIDFRWAKPIPVVIYGMTTSTQSGNWGLILLPLTSWITVFKLAQERVVFIANPMMFTGSKYPFVRNMLKFLKGEEMEVVAPSVKNEPEEKSDDSPTTAID